MRPTVLSMLAALAMVSPTVAPASAQDAPRLSMPLACDPGKTCFIQHYVDIDDGCSASIWVRRRAAIDRDCGGR